MRPHHASLGALLAEFRADPRARHPPAAQQAVWLARRLQQRAHGLQTSSERRQQAEMDRMLQTPSDKVTLAQMTDQAFRARDPHRAVDHLLFILDAQGVPRFFNFFKQALLKGFQSFGGYLPRVALPLVKEYLRRETAHVILPGERERLAQHLRQRHREGLRMNINRLGEAILGEAEARRRFEEYLETLRWPETEVVSIKISTLYSQISPLARHHTVATLCDRLEGLLRLAAQMSFTRADGQVVPKFVYLDMEEYRDKELTAEVFMRTLERPGLGAVRAGLALQSYVPDSYETLLRLQEWARRRVAGGGGRVTVRLVKGANLEMERVEASLRGWPQAPYLTKIETDANYRRLVHAVMEPENLAAMDVGIASHNLFELAYGLVLAAQRQALDKVQFELLEGMANHQRRALGEVTDRLLLYAPACRKENFINAIGYLIRRLDENTGPDNFLRHAFKITVGSPEWDRLEQQFLEAFDAIPTLSHAPRRTQNRLAACPPRGDWSDAGLPSAPAPSGSPAIACGWTGFVNEPDTDFSLPHNGEWARQILATWQPLCGDRALWIRPVFDGEGLDRPAGPGEVALADMTRSRRAELREALAGNDVASQTGPRGAQPSDGAASAALSRAQPPCSREADASRAIRECLDPSRPGVVVGRCLQAHEADLDRAVACAAADPDGWRSLSVDDRFRILGQVAEELRRARPDLMGAALAHGGKTLSESDPEVSEAVDFLEFYRDTARCWQTLPTVQARPRGVVVVVAPWNFPIAIPCGGVAAALAAGNTVILKPASDAVLVAWELCRCFWRAGVSKRALQFLPCAGGREGRRLVNDPRVNAVILTGGTATAQAMLRDNPRLSLFAETGGKNATIVSALADRDQAIKHILQSAFSHSGQKCSATSLLLLEAEVYDDPAFRRVLCDAVTSLPVGSAWQLESRMGPLIRAPDGDLARALTTLEPGEEWAVTPRQVEGNPNLWSPGVKYGVRAGSDTHLTEFFGPVLAVMRFEKLSEAVALVNQTGYGLTSGLESLDEREWDYWKEHIHAGNLYVNRVTTGAIVLRQPFGGFGKSVFGPGLKAGGPNYVAQFMEFRDAALPVGEGGPRDETLATFCRELEARAGDLGAEGGSEIGRVLAAAVGYDRWVREEFGQPHDHFKLAGQDNFRRYLSLRDVRVRVHPEDTVFDLYARVLAARAVGCRITVSCPPALATSALGLERITRPWAEAIAFIEERDDQLTEVLRARRTDRVRYAAPDRVPLAVLAAAGESGLWVVSQPVLAEGRVELLWYLREQSLSIDYHRYGNLGARAMGSHLDI